VRGVPDDHAVASLLLSRFNFLRRPGLHVVHIASEMVPVAKVGGLGDVVAGLAKAHQQRWGWGVGEGLGVPGLRLPRPGVALCSWLGFVGRKSPWVA
jgi:hypothetical protein